MHNSLLHCLTHKPHDKGTLGSQEPAKAFHRRRGSATLQPLFTFSLFFSIASEIQEINIGIYDIKIYSGAERYIKRVLTKSAVTEPLIVGSEGFLLLEQSECFATQKKLNK